MRVELCILVALDGLDRARRCHPARADADLRYRSLDSRGLHLLFTTQQKSERSRQTQFRRENPSFDFGCGALFGTRRQLLRHSRNVQGILWGGARSSCNDVYLRSRRAHSNSTRPGNRHYCAIRRRLPAWTNGFGKLASPKAIRVHRSVAVEDLIFRQPQTRSVSFTGAVLPIASVSDLRGPESHPARRMVHPVSCLPGFPCPADEANGFDLRRFTASVINQHCRSARSSWLTKCVREWQADSGRDLA